MNSFHFSLLMGAFLVVGLIQTLHAKRDVRDFTDADLERLYEQWEEGEDDDDDSDSFEKRERAPPPSIDISKLQSQNPEDLLKQTKKGQTLMIFVTAKSKSRGETEKIASLWASALFNAHIETQRHVVDDDRVMLVLSDGSRAWEVKDYLLTLDSCLDVTIEGRKYTREDVKDEL